MAYRTVRLGFEVVEIPIYFRERSEEHTSELQSRLHLVCRLLLEKKNLAIGLSGAGFAPLRLHRVQACLSTIDRFLPQILRQLFRARQNIYAPLSRCNYLGQLATQ